eukprot:scaffold138155_cov27-Tisochrysis_lutea.AAC.2
MTNLLTSYSQLESHIQFSDEIRHASSLAYPLQQSSNLRLHAMRRVIARCTHGDIQRNPIALDLACSGRGGAPHLCPDGAAGCSQRKRSRRSNCLQTS